MLKKWSLILSLIALLVLSACGNSETPESDTTDSNTDTEITSDNPPPNSDDIDTQQLELNVRGTVFVVDAPETWDNITTGSISNLEITIQPLLSMPIGDEPAEAMMSPFVSEAVEDMDVTEADNKTIYVSDNGEGDVDILIVFDETDLLVFNVTTIGDAEFSTYQDEIVTIMSSLREAE